MIEDNLLDETDRKLLDIIQSDFPITSHPYAVLGEKTGISEKEALQRVNAMRKNGIIRRLGANFQSSKLGWVSTLCAVKVPEDKRDLFIEKVNAHPGITHNYERDCVYNLWFTLISPSREAEKDSLDKLSEQTGLEILNLPAKKMYKIKVDFAMAE